MINIKLQTNFQVFECLTFLKGSNIFLDEISILRSIGSFLELLIAAVFVGKFGATFALFVSGITWVRLGLNLFFLILALLPILLQFFDDLQLFQLFLYHVLLFVLVKQVFVHVLIQKFKLFYCRLIWLVSNLPDTHVMLEVFMLEVSQMNDSECWLAQHRTHYDLLKTYLVNYHHALETLA